MLKYMNDVTRPYLVISDLECFGVQQTYCMSRDLTTVHAWRDCVASDSQGLSAFAPMRRSHGHECLKALCVYMSLQEATWQLLVFGIGTPRPLPFRSFHPSHRSSRKGTGTRRQGGTAHIIPGMKANVETQVFCIGAPSPSFFPSLSGGSRALSRRCVASWLYMSCARMNGSSRNMCPHALLLRQSL